MNVYENIRKRREELHMSQDQLAEKMGYSDKSIVSRLENGKRRLTTEALSELAVCLRTTPAALCGWEDDYYINEEARDLAEFLYKNPDYKVLFDASRKVKPDDIKFVQQMIERMNGNDN